MNGFFYTDTAHVAAVAGAGVVLVGYAYWYDAGIYIRIATWLDRWTTARATVDAVADGWIPDPDDVGLVLIDHATCEGDDCDRIICCCPRPTECPNTTAQACTHHNLLCNECRTSCTDCRIDARDDAEAYR